MFFLLQGDRSPYINDQIVDDALLVNERYHWSVYKDLKINPELRANSAINYDRYDIVFHLYNEKKLPDESFIQLIVSQPIEPSKTLEMVTAILKEDERSFIVNLFHYSDLKSNCVLFSDLMVAANILTKEEESQMLYDAVSGGEYRIVRDVMADKRTDPIEELGTHHELYFVAMSLQQTNLG